MSAAGTWNLTVDTPIGKQHARLVLSQEADGTWKGNSVSLDSGEEAELNELTVNGNELSWQLTVTKPMKLNTKTNVTIDGDTMTGKTKAGMFPAVKVTGERAS